MLASLPQQLSDIETRAVHRCRPHVLYVRAKCHSAVLLALTLCRAQLDLLDCCQGLLQFLQGGAWNAEAPLPESTTEA